MYVQSRSSKEPASPLIAAVARRYERMVSLVLDDGDVEADVAAIFNAFELQRIRRYHRQRFWEVESLEADFSDRIEPGLKLENVAAHSWHVADTALILAGHFPEIRIQHAVCLAILHDKLEIYTGDIDPLGEDGTGATTHAFDLTAKSLKKIAEQAALEQYLRTLRPSLRKQQLSLFSELEVAITPEAKFVKAIDKLQSFAFVLSKKSGDLSNIHLDFTIRYSFKAVEYWPGLRFHYEFLLKLLLDQVAAARRVPRHELEGELFNQLELRL